MLLQFTVHRGFRAKTFYVTNRTPNLTLCVLNEFNCSEYIHLTCVTKSKLNLDSPEPIDIRLWTRNGEIQSWHRCISLKYDFYKGTRRMKLLDSNEIRQLRDVCIFEVNGIKVYM